MQSEGMEILRNRCSLKADQIFMSGVKAAQGERKALALPLVKLAYALVGHYAGYSVSARPLNF